MGKNIIEKDFEKVKDFVGDHKIGIGVAIAAVVAVIVIGVIAFIVYHFWFHSDSTTSTSNTPLTPEEEGNLFKSVANKLIGTKRYFQLHSIPNKYLDSASTNTVWDITSGFGTAPKGNCFYSDNNKYAVHIDENSYIYLLKESNSASGIWEISKVLYDADSSNTHEEPYSLVINKQGDPGNFTATSKTEFALKGSTPAVVIKQFHPLLTFGATNASNYRLYIDESTGKVRVRVYGASFTSFEAANDVEVVSL